MKYLYSLLALVLLSACSTTEPSTAQVAGLWPDCPTGQGNINNANLIIPADSVDLDLFGGALVAAFTQDGTCAGSTIFQFRGGGSAVNLILWGADETAPDPRGATVGDTLTLRVLNEIEPVTWFDKPFVYEHDGIYGITSAGYPNDQTDTINNLQNQINQLEQDLAAMTAERDAHLAQINTLLDENTTLESQNTTLQTEVDNLTTQNTNLQTQVSQYQTELGEAQTTNTALTERIDTVVAILTSEL